MRSMIRTRLMAGLAGCLALAGLAAPATAQTNTENFAQFRFNFNNPGARAAGIGGAFISIADDATAAEANPAGLTALLRPELSLEGKGIEFQTKVDNFSHTGTAANFTLESKKFKNSLFSPSFVSIVFPWRRFTFSGFRHELVNFESAFYTKGSFVKSIFPGSSFFPVTSQTRLRVTNYGGAVSYKIREWLSVGVSGGVSTISMTSSLSRYFSEVFNEGNLANSAKIDDSGSDFFINAGVLVRPVENLAIGAIFKRRPMFTLQHAFRFARFPTDSTTIKKINFNVPSSMGIGASYRPTDVLTIAFDAVYIRYAQLTDDFVLTISEDFATKNDFAVDNGWELHGGAEYVIFLGSMGVVLRAGVYLEPDNRIRWVGNVNDSNNPSRIFSRQLLEGLFRSGDSYLHTTFGLGFVLSNNFQLDVAGNLSSVTNEAVGSLVVRF